MYYCIPSHILLNRSSLPCLLPFNTTRERHNILSKLFLCVNSSSCSGKNINWLCFLVKFHHGLFHRLYSYMWAGIAQWLEQRTHDWKVAGSNPCRSGGIIFFSGVDFLCWLLFRYPFHPRVTAVARKRSQSFCQKCRWQVTAKYAYTLRMWLCMKWHGAWLYGVHRTCAETAAVSCGTSHASA